MTAAFDYTRLSTVFTSLVDRFGVDVVLTRPSRAAVETWQQDQGPASASAAQDISGLRGVQVALDKDALALQTIERQVGRWAVTTVDALPEEVGLEWSMTAKGLSYPIINVRPVRPGPVLLGYFITVQL